MQIFTNPSWTNRTLYQVKSLDKVSNDVFDQINDRLRLHCPNGEKPVVSICIAAWNEELNILKCIDSISHNKFEIPFEIVVINNNSSDRTQEVLDKLHVNSFFQPVQGCGVSRQLAQEKAKGSYVLSADADCLYPITWVRTMYRELKKTNTGAIYSRHSFLGDSDIPRWKFFLYEIGKRLIMEVRNFRRPYLNAYGMSMGYLKEHGLKEGFVTRNIRGEDGRMCFDLMKYGKIRFIRTSKAKVWTSDRNLDKDGSFANSLVKRLMREILRFKEYFKKPIPHDTKTSENTDMSKEGYKEAIIDKFKRGKS